MLLKTFSIEYGRRFRKTKVVSFHPGTTDTELSKPYQAGIPKEKLFKTDFVANRLHGLLVESKADGKLSFKDWRYMNIDW